jgi:hypothetical protein
MKILAVFLLSGFFLFFAGVPCRAQSCNRYTSGEITVKDITDNLDCLNKKTESLEDDKYYLESEIDDLQRKLDQTELELHTAKTKIETLEGTLRSDEHMTEAMFSLFARAGKSKPAFNPAGKPESGTSSTKTPASKPKAPVNPPKAGASKPKALVNNPTLQQEWDQAQPLKSPPKAAPVNKPKPAVKDDSFIPDAPPKEGTH